MNRIESILDWYGRDKAGWAKYYSTRFLGPYLASVAILTLATILFRNFAWFLAWASMVGFIGFIIGAIVACLGVMDMNIHGGPRDGISTIVGGVVVILAMILTVLGIACFSSFLFSFAILRLQVPTGW